MRLFLFLNPSSLYLTELLASIAYLNQVELGTSAANFKLDSSFHYQVSNQDLEDTYQPPFRSCVQQGKASCLMCSYNRVNGVPACARQDLFQKAKTEWGFKG